MHDYLGEHPQIYAATPKEPYFFNSDLWCDPRYCTRNEDDYLKLFCGAKKEHLRIGESSVGYLYSQKAPEEIKRVCEDPRFIVMLRNPTEMIYSLHQQCLHSGNEDIFDFEEALELEPQRKAGHQLPDGCHFPTSILYRQCCDYSSYIEYWLSHFDRSRFHFIVFDDLKHSAADVYRATLEFLEVDPTFQPDFSIRNASHDLSDVRIAQFWKTHPRIASLRGSRYFIPVLNYPLRLFLRSPNRRPPMRAELRRQLRDEFADQISRLECLIERDLACWRTENRAMESRAA